MRAWMINTKFFARQSSCCCIARDGHVDKCLSLACSILNVWNSTIVCMFLHWACFYVWYACLKVDIYLCIANCMISDLPFIWQVATALFHISGSEICTHSVITGAIKVRLHVVSPVFCQTVLTATCRAYCMNVCVLMLKHWPLQSHFLKSNMLHIYAECCNP